MPPDPRTSASPESACSVLVVDDDPQILPLFERILSRRGYTVLTANSGKLAINILQARPVDVLVLDLSMPDMDGFDLLKTLRTIRPGLKILVVSGFMQGAMLRAAELLGASASLSKTSAPANLAEAVARLLQQ